MRYTILILEVCLLAQASNLTIQEALDRTAKLSPDVQLARLQALESESRTAQIKSAYQPQASIVIGGTYQTSNLQGIGLIFPGFPSRLGPYRTFNARPQVTQTIVDLSLLTRIRQARVTEKQAKAEARTVAEDTELAVAQLYLQALSADARAVAAAARLSSAQAVAAQANEKQRAGTGSKLDVARAEQEVESERGLEIDARREASVLKTMLIRTIGLDSSPEDLALTPPSVTEVNGDLRAKASAQRPELEALRLKSDAATLDTKAAAAERLPKLSGFGDYGVNGAGPDRSLSTYTVGASLTIPVWTGRRIESTVAQSRVKQTEIEQETRRVNLQIRQELDSAQVESAAARERLTSAERGRAFARETLELVRLRYESGLATSVDTQVAQSTLASADEAAIRAGYDLSLAQARLAKAAGELRAAFR